VLFILGLVAGWLIERAVPLPLAGPPGRRSGAIAGWLLIALGAGLSGWAVATFRRARTTIIPHRPASALVTGGPFRFSRNPMYVALSLAYLGVTALVNSVWPLLLFPAVMAALLLTVVRLEERYLGAAFGKAYAEYRRRVRRWL
jgi:protein-S-isoprenylcysteine O-methyltransferase Ste14